MLILFIYKKSLGITFSGIMFNNIIGPVKTCLVKIIAAQRSTLSDIGHGTGPGTKEHGGSDPPPGKNGPRVILIHYTCITHTVLGISKIVYKYTLCYSADKHSDIFGNCNWIKSKYHFRFRECPCVKVDQHCFLSPSCATKMPYLD